MSGYTRAPRCSSGCRRAHSPILPPVIDGDAAIRNACLPLKGWGLNRETQSIVFLRTPDIDALYSGDAIMNPSVATSLSWSACAPAGRPCANSVSRSYGGHSKSAIDAFSTAAPFSSATSAPSDASMSFIEPLRIDAPKTRSRTEHRFSFAIAIPLTLRAVEPRADAAFDHWSSNSRTRHTRLNFVAEGRKPQQRARRSVSAL